MKDAKLFLLSTFVFASVFFAFSIGNGIEPSALITKIQADVQLFTGEPNQPLLPQPPMG